MKGKKIKQINNLTIYQDTIKQVNYFGNIMDNPNFEKYSVYTPDGRCLEDRMTLEQAEDLCKNTKDFLKKQSLNERISNVTQQLNKSPKKNQSSQLETMKNGPIKE